jgi:hypothetical protein
MSKSRIQASVLAIAMALCAAAARAQDATGALIAVGVDPRIELLSLVFRLAGNPEYNQPNSRSPYAERVEEHFGAFRDHEVVGAAQQLRAKRGVSYDAVMSLAVHLEDTVTLEERIPFDLPPARLDRRWRAGEARDFLEKLRHFVSESEFNQFIATEREFYAEVGRRMNREVAGRKYVAWFDAFFGARPEARFRAVPGLLNGGACYGSGIRFPDGREEIIPVIGVWSWDEEGGVVFDEGFEPTFVHELCHSYTNPLVDRHAGELEEVGKRLFAPCREIMARQAYGTWKTVMYESLVRASVVRYLRDRRGEGAARRRVAEDVGRGFAWTGELAALLGRYEQARDRYPDLEAFMPRIVGFFEGYVPGYESEVAKRPRVRSLVPANGAAGVDPALTEIRIVFDRPMRRGSWSICGGGPRFPEITGKPAYDPDGRTLRVPVSLKPAWRYEFSLNSTAFQGFRSEAGVPLQPLPVRFETRAE